MDRYNNNWVRQWGAWHALVVIISVSEDDDDLNITYCIVGLYCQLNIKSGKMILDLGKWSGSRWGRRLDKGLDALDDCSSQQARNERFERRNSRGIIIGFLSFVCDQFIKMWSCSPGLGQSERGQASNQLIIPSFLSIACIFAKSKYFGSNNNRWGVF